MENDWKMRTRERSYERSTHAMWVEEDSAAAASVVAAAAAVGNAAATPRESPICMHTSNFGDQKHE